VLAEGQLGHAVEVEVGQDLGFDQLMDLGQVAALNSLSCFRISMTSSVVVRASTSGGVSWPARGRKSPAACQQQKK
jgi:hypothetical protein